MADTGISSAAAGTSSLLSTAAPIIGAGIDAVANVAGGLFSANQAAKNRQWQTRMYERQLKDNLENWERVNAYNLPSAQLARLRQANLNPLLMYGEGGASLVAQSKPDAARVGSGAQANWNGQTNFGQALTQAALVNAQIRNIEADTDVKKASAAESQSRTTGINIENEVAQDTKEVRKWIQWDNHDMARASIRKLENDIFQSSFMNAETAHTMALSREYLVKRFELDKHVSAEQIKGMWKGLANGSIQASAAWKNAAAALMNAASNAALTDAQITQIGRVVENWDLQNDFLKRTMNSRVLGVDLSNKESVARSADLGWSVLLKEAGIEKAQSEKFLNEIKRYQIENDIQWKDFYNDFAIASRLFYMAK